MVLYKFTNGTAADATQVNAAIAEGYTIAGLNLARSLIDRAGVWSAGLIDWWGDAYISAGGREGSVDTGATTATYYTTTNTYVPIETKTSENWNTTIGADASSSTHNMTATLTTNGYFSSVRGYCPGTTGTAVVTILVGAEVIVTKNVPFTNHIWAASFALEDYSRILTSSDTVTIRSYEVIGGIYYKNNQSYSGTFFSLASQAVNGYSGGAADMLIFTEVEEGEQTIMHDIPAGTFSDTITTAIGVPLIEDWEDGADIKYKLTGTAGAEDTGWLDAMNSEPEVSTFTAFTAEPDTLIVKLIPKTTSPTAGYPSIKAFTVRCD